MNDIIETIKSQNYNNLETLHNTNEGILDTLTSIANISNPSKVYYTPEANRLGRFNPTGGELTKLGGKLLESTLRTAWNYYAEIRKTPDAKVNASTTAEKLELVENALEAHLTKIEDLDLTQFQPEELKKLNKEVSSLAVKLKTASIGIANMSNAYGTDIRKASGINKELVKHESLQKRAQEQKVKIETIQEKNEANSFYSEKKEEITVPLLTLKKLTSEQELSYDPKGSFSYVTSEITETTSNLQRKADAVKTWALKNNTAVVEGLFKLTDHIEDYVHFALVHEPSDIDFLKDRLRDLGEFKKALDGSEVAFEKIKSYHTKSYGSDHRVIPAIDKLSNIKKRVDEGIRVLENQKIEKEKVLATLVQPSEKKVIETPASPRESVQQSTPASPAPPAPTAAPPPPPPMGKIPPPPPPMGKAGPGSAADSKARRARERLDTLSNPKLFYKNTVDEAKLQPIKDKIASHEKSIATRHKMLGTQLPDDARKIAEAELQESETGKKEEQAKLDSEKNKGLTVFSPLEFAAFLTKDYPTEHLKLILSILLTDKELQARIERTPDSSALDAAQDVVQASPEAKAAYEKYNEGWVSLIKAMPGAGLDSFIKILKERLTGKTADVPLVRETKNAPTGTAKKAPVDRGDFMASLRKMVETGETGLKKPGERKERRGTLPPKAPADKVDSRTSLNKMVPGDDKGLKKPDDRHVKSAGTPVSQATRLKKTVPEPAKQKDEYGLRGEFLTSIKDEFNRAYNRKDRELIADKKYIVGIKQVTTLLSAKNRTAKEQKLLEELNYITARKDAINALLLSPDPTNNDVFLAFKDKYASAEWQKAEFLTSMHTEFNRAYDHKDSELLADEKYKIGFEQTIALLSENTNRTEDEQKLLDDLTYIQERKEAINALIRLPNARDDKVFLPFKDTYAKAEWQKIEKEQK